MRYSQALRPFVLLLCCGFMLSATPALADTLRVGAGLDTSVAGNYNTISAAMSASKEGDVIRVESGTYEESVSVYSKRTLIGAGSNLTIVTGSINMVDHSAVANLKADQIYASSHFEGVVVSGCKMRLLRPYQHWRVEDCEAQTLAGSAYYDSSYNNVFVGCKFTEKIDGIDGQNVFLACDFDVTYFTIGSQNVLKNNIIKFTDTDGDGNASRFSQGSQQWEQNTLILSGHEITPGEYWKNNIIYTSASPTIDKNGNLTGNPKFVNLAGGDYRLATGSPAINAGMGLDSNGSKADIGAYGGVTNTLWNAPVEQAGKPVVGRLVVSPNPIAPGEPLKLEFTARSNP